MNIAVLTQSDMSQKFVSASHLELVLLLAAIVFERGGPRLTEQGLVDAAHIASCPIALVNLAGGQDELVFAGGSLAVSADGQLLHRAPLFAENLSLLRVDEQGDINPEEDE